MAVMNTYCFIMSTFILPRHLPAAGSERLHPGVGPEKPGEEREYQAYYQWVPFVLFLQGTPLNSWERTKKKKCRHPKYLSNQ
jgi:hypothetical protein